MSLNFPLHSLKFSLYLPLFFLFLLSQNPENERELYPLLFKACFLTLILMPFFFCIPSGTFSQNSSPVLPLFKSVLLAGPFPQFSDHAQVIWGD